MKKASKTKTLKSKVEQKNTNDFNLNDNDFETFMLYVQVKAIQIKGTTFNYTGSTKQIYEKIKKDEVLFKSIKEQYDATIIDDGVLSKDKIKIILSETLTMLKMMNASTKIIESDAKIKQIGDDIKSEKISEKEAIMGVIEEQIKQEQVFKENSTESETQNTTESVTESETQNTTQSEIPSEIPSETKNTTESVTESEIPSETPDDDLSPYLSQIKPYLDNSDMYFRFNVTAWFICIVLYAVLIVSGLSINNTAKEYKIKFENLEKKIELQDKTIQDLIKDINPEISNQSI